MKLAINRLTLGVSQFEGMRSITIHMPMSLRSSTIRKQERNLMSRLLSQSDEVPKHIRILQVSHRVPLLGVDETWKEDGIPDKEDGRVVADQIPVSIVGVELDSKAARITSSVSRSGLTADCTEANGKRSLLSHSGEN